MKTKTDFDLGPKSKATYPICATDKADNSLQRPLERTFRTGEVYNQYRPVTPLIPVTVD